jgi:hypothetical protein
MARFKQHSWLRGHFIGREDHIGARFDPGGVCCTAAFRTGDGAEIFRHMNRTPARPPRQARFVNMSALKSEECATIIPPRAEAS